MKVIKTKNLAVYCDGGQGSAGHPRIYLTIKPSEGMVKCPYCGAEFEYSGA